jgi:glycogen operon protein
MLTAGDEFGRTQHGNNNAYCQDNVLTWLDWENRDRELVETTAGLAAIRQRFTAFSDTQFLDGNGDVEWLSASGEAMTVADWEDPDLQVFAMVLKTLDRQTAKPARVAVLFNRAHEARDAVLNPETGRKWRKLSSSRGAAAIHLKPRSVEFWLEA